jgi:hypothetical protein
MGVNILTPINSASADSNRNFGTKSAESIDNSVFIGKGIFKNY